jgi:HD-GYP domain-containing protein (c-di-GMP phosphodiesterase class II)
VIQDALATADIAYVTSAAVVQVPADAARPSRGAGDPDELIEAGRARDRSRLARRDKVSAALIGGAFAGVAGLLAVSVDVAREPSILVVATLVAAYAAASWVKFEIGSVWAVPTQLVLVPMLFVLPLGWVPLAVAAGLSAGTAVDLVHGRRFHPEHLYLRLIDSWHAVGPVLVLWAAGATEASVEDLPIYAAALLAQFAFDFAGTGLRNWAALGVKPRVLLRSGVWTWSVDTALAPIGLSVAVAAASAPWAFLLVMPLVGLIAYFARERRVRIDHALELSTAYRGTALLLGDVVEADDAYTGTHSRDVVWLSLAVAEELRVSGRELRLTEMTALLHDVGKIRIPSDIINKPGALTPAERAIIDTHTIEGEKLLGRVGGLLGEVGVLVRSCHERWDGTGYPDGLAGEDIHVVARIVCACDAFNAMTTDRPYRAARSTDEALVEMEACAGTHFDPTVVRALVAVATRDDARAA